MQENLSGDNFISTVTIEHYLEKLLSANTESNFTSTFDLSNPNSRKRDIDNKISSFIASTTSTKLFIPIYNGHNHFTLLYVKKTEEDNSKIDIVYIDPTARPRRSIGRKNKYH